MSDTIGNNNLLFFLFSEGTPRIQHRGGLVTGKFPCASPVLGAGQEEVGVVGYIVPRNQTVLCPRMRILHKIWKVQKL